MTKNGDISDKTSKEIDEMQESIALSDLVDVDFLQKFQDVFSTTLGIAALTTDKNGEPITKGSNFTDFCMKHSRGTREGLRRCMESDAYGGAESARTGKPAVYFCGSGLMDFGAPIMINGKQVGCILGGQTLPAPPDKKKFAQIAKEIGVDETEFLEALDKVKIVPEERVRAAAELLSIVANKVSQMGYEKLVLMRTTLKLHENIMQIMATIQQLTASATGVTQNQSSLNDEIQKVGKIIGEISGLTESIKVIADQTRMLGLNASIEAARAGEAGLGFGVVAKQIHKLSNESKNTVEKIMKFTSEINHSVTQTTVMSNSTLETTSQQEQAIKSIVTSVEDVANVTEMLSRLTARS